ncbi:MAG: tetratricopeptide repeat protein [Kiritimatiellae bacterium]|nr:tetratricopeptide repeat protein [Kiritimatiellia bacterium]
MMTNVAELEEQALAHMRNSRWADAVPLLKELLDSNPNFEHGSPWYDLACCHDELGNVGEARACYLRALSFDNNSPNFWGGWASFLYRHGDPREALNAFSKYRELVGEDSELGKKVLPAIDALEKKLGHSS